MFVLLEGEMRSLMRNACELVIGSKFNKKYSNIENIVLKLSIRVVSSLIAVYLFNNLKSNSNIKTYLSYIMVLIFLFFVYREYN